VGLNPLGGNVANIAVVVPKPAFPRGRVDRAGDSGLEGRFFRELARFPAVSGRVSPSGVVRRVMASGPFAARTRPVIAPGAILTGDAAEFFDPFTGDGLGTAFRGAELIEEYLVEPLRSGRPMDRPALRLYAGARRRAFLGKWIVERLIGYSMLRPEFFDRALSRLERKELGHTLVGVTGGFVPARAVLNPGFLLQVVFG
jgi:flavin-dependent dehydrogenase